MKLEDFLGSGVAVPGQLTVDDCIALVEEETPQEEFVTSLTPSGIEVYYSWHPKRYYKLRHHNPAALPLHEGVYDGEWVECPSVTNVLNVLDKSGALSWWAQGQACEGVLTLHEREKFFADSDNCIVLSEGKWLPATKELLVSLLVSEQISINHKKDAAATRGVNVHSAFEKFCDDITYRPILDTYPENEQGYIRGLIAFLDDLGDVVDVESEVMVGSIVHGYAGRYDVRLGLKESREMVTRVYPVREPKREEVPAGRWLMDVKTSKRVYPTHAAQLAAYELASVEDGYGATDYRAVIHLTEDGRYELVQTYATSEDFLAILAAHNVMQNAKAWT